MSKAKITYRFNQASNHFQEYRPQPKSAFDQSEATPSHSQRQDDRSEFEDEPRKTAEEPELSQRNPSDDRKVYDVQGLNQFTNDFGAWNSPFDVETEKLEELIRDTPQRDISSPSADKNTARNHANAGLDHAAEQPQMHEQAQRTGPDISELVAAEHKSKKLHAPAWSKLLMSASAAVITGVFLGSLILNMFSSNVNQPSQPDFPASTVDGTNSDPGESEGGGGLPGALPPEDDTDGEAVIASVDIPGETYFFLQNGLFSTEETAQAAQMILERNGFPSVIDPSDGGYRIYAGFSTNRDEALFLSHHIEQQNLETYIKEISRPAVTHIQWSSENVNVFKDYLSTSAELVAALNESSTSLLRNDAELTADDLQQLTSLHQTWTTHASSIANTALSSEQKSHVGQMNALMNTAMESMSEYADHANETYLWQAQTALMQYIFLEKGWVQSTTP